MFLFALNAINLPRAAGPMGDMIKMMLPAILLAMDQAIHEFKTNPEVAAGVCAQFDVNGCVFYSSFFSIPRISLGLEPHICVHSWVFSFLLFDSCHACHAMHAPVLDLTHRPSRYQSKSQRRQGQQG